MEAYEGFREFVLARGGGLSRSAYLLTGSKPAAEELVQATLVKAALRWRRVVAAGNPDAYVRRIMVNEHISWWRRFGRREVPDVDTPELQHPDPAGSTVAGGNDRVPFDALIAPGRLHVRFVVAETSGRPGDAVFPAPSGAPPSLDQVIAKLGGAYQAALALDGPADDPVLAPFGHLSPQEVGLLAPRMQFNVSAISCALLDARRDTDFPAQSEIAVCEGATASYCSAPCGCRAPTSVTPCPPFSP